MINTLSFIPIWFSILIYLVGAFGTLVLLVKIDHKKVEREPFGTFMIAVLWPPFCVLVILAMLCFGFSDLIMGAAKWCAGVEK